ncbi:DUF859 family phage minor structural protein [Leucobacter luti]|uniref:DUF859 family phage minor structural protein n=1 Tax=Leucobacter luti TaxID=340320 RepID=UPI003CFDEF55
MAVFYSPWQNHFRLRTHVDVMSQNVAANTSTIRTLSYIEAEPGWWFSGAWINASVWMNGGQVAADNASRSVGNGGEVAVVEYWRTVSHAADGTLSVSFSTNAVATSIISFNQWAGGTITAPTIPRATSPSWSGAFTAGAAKTISLLRASSSFTHDVTYQFGEVRGTIATGAGVSASWTPPLSLLEVIPKDVTGTGTITVVTKSGSTVIGTKSARFDLNAAANVVPEVNAVTWADTNSTIATAIGAFVQGLSAVRATIAASGVYGSTITTRRVRIGTAVFPDGAAIAVDGAGTIAAKGEAVDTRARVGVLDAPLDVLPYSPPTIVGFKVSRANSAGAPLEGGTYLLMDLESAAQSLIVGAEKNAMRIVVKTRTGTGAWVTRQTITPGLTYDAAVLVGGGGVYLPTSSYDVRVEITDNTGTTAVAETTVPTGVVTIDMKGNRVGVGKYHEYGGLDVAEQINDRGGITSPVGAVLEFAGATAPRGWLICDGSEVSRTGYADLFAVIGEAFGAGDGSTTFRLPDHRGRVGVGLSADAEFNVLGKTGGAKTHTLTTAEMPNHEHRTLNTGDVWVYQGTASLAGGTPHGGRTVANQMTGKTGGGGAHNNLQPYIAVNYIIRY